LQIKVYEADGTPNTLISDNLKAPSAVVVHEPGRAFAVKDDHVIALYDLRNGHLVMNIAEQLRKPMGQQLPASFLLCILGETGLTMALMMSCSQLCPSHQ
jgi:hypothetical protein